jgi:exosortase/archaeosortase family protein
MRAVIAIISMACMISICRLGKPFHAGIWGLFLLSLPLISSIQFFLGYPLRVVAGEAGALLLQMSGFSVIREGTMLNWCGHLISIDAPCSGVKMLWTGLYLALTLSCFYDLKPLKSILVVLFAIIVIMMSNILRATSLFYIEAGVLNLPLWSHTVLGIIIFVLTSAAIVWITLETVSKPSIGLKIKAGDRFKSDE